MNSWIGVDLDGTLAVYNGWKGPGHIGQPITTMVIRVKLWLLEGKKVKIMTARVSKLYDPDATAAEIEEALACKLSIEDWCEDHLGQRLEVTAVKDYGMTVLYDDRCVQVITNQGKIVGPL